MRKRCEEVRRKEDKRGDADREKYKGSQVVARKGKRGEVEVEVGEVEVKGTELMNIE